MKRSEDNIVIDKKEVREKIEEISKDKHVVVITKISDSENSSITRIVR